MSGDPENTDPRVLIGEAFDEDYAMEMGAIESKTGIHIWRKCETMVAYTYEDWDHLRELLPINRKCEKQGEGYFVMGFNFTWDALSHYELYLTSGKRKHKREGRRCHKTVQKWATSGTVMLAGVNKLLTATESLCVRKDPVHVVETLFQEAIAALAENKNRYFEALANERLARLYLTDDLKSTKGLVYLASAVDLYNRWGALAKAEWLQKRYNLASYV